MSERWLGLESGIVEVTPAMVAAGVRELASFNPREDSFEAAVELIFVAMFEAMPEKQRRWAPEESDK